MNHRGLCSFLKPRSQRALASGCTLFSDWISTKASRHLLSRLLCVLQKAKTARRTLLRMMKSVYVQRYSRHLKSLIHVVMWQCKCFPTGKDTRNAVQGTKGIILRKELHCYNWLESVRSSVLCSSTMVVFEAPELLKTFLQSTQAPTNWALRL